MPLSQPCHWWTVSHYQKNSVESFRASALLKCYTTVRYGRLRLEHSYRFMATFLKSRHLMPSAKSVWAPSILDVPLHVLLSPLEPRGFADGPVLDVVPLTAPHCCSWRLSGLAERLTRLELSGLLKCLCDSVRENLRGMRINHYSGLWSEIREGGQWLRDKRTVRDELWSAHCQGLFCLVAHSLHKMILLSVSPCICVTFHPVCVRSHG